MRKIFGIGETVLDLIFKDGEPQAARPGGSMLNAMVSLGRIGLPVHFISEYGLDDTGELVNSLLERNGVDTGSVYRYRDGKTALAIAFLDENNNAHYTFYRDFPASRLNAGFPEISEKDILLYGSFYSIAPEIREKVREFIRQARKNGALLIYDPNFRKAHLHELDRLKPFILENMQMANLVKGSDEDFGNIFGTTGPDEAWDAIRDLCPNLVFTQGSGNVEVRTLSFKGSFPVPKITPVSTIGAGDNFNAGLVFTFNQSNIGREVISKIGKSQWKKTVETAVEFASDVCGGFDNYISWELARKQNVKLSTL